MADVCVACRVPVVAVLDKTGKVDHWIDHDGHATATDIPDAYDLLESLRERTPHDLSAACAYSTLKVRLNLGMSFHQHQGVRNAQ